MLPLLFRELGIDMVARSIININDPRMKSISAPVEKFDSALAKLVHEMVIAMEEARGIGLAAVQLGELVRVIVTCAADKAGEEKTMALVNPVITSKSTESIETNEGCLSIPGVRLAFNRPIEVTVDYFDIDGARKTIVATGMQATCIQHEIDHLDGILILDHVSKLRRDRAVAAFKKTARFR
jgi:peptide deformylase